MVDELLTNISDTIRAEYLAWLIVPDIVVAGNGFIRNVGHRIPVVLGKVLLRQAGAGAVMSHIGGNIIGKGTAYGFEFIDRGCALSFQCIAGG